jgi:cytochrome c oxidase subunit II
MARNASRWGGGAIAVMLLAGCDGPQSSLSPGGRGADRIAELFWWMVAGAGLVWLFMVALGFYAIRVRPQAHSVRRTRLLVIGGGVAFPTILLAILLIYGLRLLPELLAPAPAGALRIAITGEQWWWRVRYLQAEGEPIELANEVRLPVGEPVEFLLESADVIHSFWIPSLGGKVDMIPGRQTRLVLEPERVGTYRGICAEYCGGSHALMALDVVVAPGEAVRSWLEEQARPAAIPRTAEGRRGATLFTAYGCGACHTIRGSAANGVVGPDLTHVGGRLTLGASLLDNHFSSFVQWIAESEKLKPQVHMPAFNMIPEDDLRDLAVYLSELK